VGVVIALFWVLCSLVFVVLLVLFFRKPGPPSSQPGREPDSQPTASQPACLPRQASLPVSLPMI